MNRLLRVLVRGAERLPFPVLIKDERLCWRYANEAACELFDLPHVFTETLCLLFSSASYGLVMLALHRNRKAQVLAWLAVTFVLGASFIFIEVSEFHTMILAGNGPARSAFLSAFFTLVGTHGTHVSFGLIWMLVMMLQIARKGLTAPVRTRLLCLSLFWHFLDIVWIGVFTVVYLMGVMQ